MNRYLIHRDVSVKLTPTEEKEMVLSLKTMMAAARFYGGFKNDSNWQLDPIEKK